MYAPSLDTSLNALSLTWIRLQCISLICYSPERGLDRFQNEDNLTHMHLTLPMLRLLSSNAQVCKPCHVGIHWIALTEYFHMSTHVHVPAFQSSLGFFASFCIGKISHQQYKGYASHRLHSHLGSFYKQAMGFVEIDLKGLRSVPLLRWHVVF